jgi:ribosome maturation factor RimP
MNITERVQALVDPIAHDMEVEVVDVEQVDGAIRVSVDQPGGIGIDEITKVTRALSRALDEADPIPGRYTLEVSSPGLERPLRLPRHFQGAVGATVTLKTLPDVDGPRRVVGLLAAADDDGIVVRDPETLADRTLQYDQIAKARTVFEWGPAPKPGGGRNQRKKAAAR